VLAGLRRSVARWLIDCEVDESERFPITLACSEAAANAIEHGYGRNSATFTVDCRFYDGEVEVVVRDHGVWRAARPERGRGMLLMRELMDAVEFDQTPGGTVVTMRKRVQGHG
jgi:serine/threonine-protein kinase RsbW